MNILHIIFNLRIGGTETMLVDIINCQAKSTHKVNLLLINDEHDERLLSKIDPGITIVSLDRREGDNNPLWFWRVNRSIAKIAPDIVHAHNVMALGYLFFRSRYKLLFTLHTTGIGHRNYIRKADSLVAISDAVRDDVKARYGFECMTINNGVPLENIRRRPADRRLNPDNIRIVHTSRLHTLTKGQDVAVRALAILSDRYNISIDFIGEGPSRPEIEELAISLGVRNRIRFLGTLSRDSILDCLHQYDIAIQPSRQEGFGLTLIEAMAARLPVASSDLPALLESTNNGEFAETFKSEDAEGMAKAISRIIDDYPHMLERANGDAANFIQRFDIAITAGKYLDEYSRLIK